MQITKTMTLTNECMGLRNSPVKCQAHALDRCKFIFSHHISSLIGFQRMDMFKLQDAWYEVYTTPINLAMQTFPATSVCPMHLNDVVWRTDSISSFASSSCTSMRVLRKLWTLRAINVSREGRKSSGVNSFFVECHIYSLQKKASWQNPCHYRVAVYFVSIRSALFGVVWVVQRTSVLHAVTAQWQLRPFCRRAYPQRFVTVTYAYQVGLYIKRVSYRSIRKRDRNIFVE